MALRARGAALVPPPALQRAPVLASRLAASLGGGAANGAQWAAPAPARGFLTAAAAADVAADRDAFAAIVAHVTDGATGSPDPEALQAAAACCHSAPQLAELAGVYASLRRRGVALSVFEVQLFVATAARFGALADALALVADVLRDAQEPSHWWRACGGPLVRMCETAAQVRAVVDAFGREAVSLATAGGGDDESFSAGADDDLPLLLRLCIAHGNGDAGTDVVRAWRGDVDAGHGDERALQHFLRANLVDPVVEACDAAASAAATDTHGTAGEGDGAHERGGSLAATLFGRGPAALARRVAAGEHPLVEPSVTGPSARPHVVATLAAAGADALRAVFSNAPGLRPQAACSLPTPAQRLYVTAAAQSLLETDAAAELAGAVSVLRRHAADAAWAGLGAAGDYSSAPAPLDAHHADAVIRAVVSSLLNGAQSSGGGSSLVAASSATQLTDALDALAWVRAACDSLPPSTALLPATETVVYAAAAAVLSRSVGAAASCADGARAVLNALLDLFTSLRARGAPVLDASLVQLLACIGTVAGAAPGAGGSAALLQDSIARMRQALLHAPAQQRVPAGRQRSLFGEASVALLQQAAATASAAARQQASPRGKAGSRTAAASTAGASTAAAAAPPVHLTGRGVRAFPPLYFHGVPPPPYLFEGPAQYDPLGFTRSLFGGSGGKARAGGADGVTHAATAAADDGGGGTDALAVRGVSAVGAYAPAAARAPSEAAITQRVRARLRERGGFLTGHDAAAAARAAEEAASAGPAADASAVAVAGEAPYAADPVAAFALAGDHLLLRALALQSPPPPAGTSCAPAALLSSNVAVDGALAAVIARLRGVDDAAFASLTGGAAGQPALASALKSLLARGAGGGGAPLSTGEAAAVSLLLNAQLALATASGCASAQDLALLAAAARAEAGTAVRLLSDATLALALPLLGHDGGCGFEALPPDVCVHFVERALQAVSSPMSPLLQPQSDDRHAALLSAAYSALLHAAATGALPRALAARGGAPAVQVVLPATPTAGGGEPASPLFRPPRLPDSAPSVRLAWAADGSSGGADASEQQHYWGLRALAVACARLGLPQPAALLAHHPRESRGALVSVACCGAAPLSAALGTSNAGGALGAGAAAAASLPLSPADGQFIERTARLMLAQGQLPAALGLYWAVRQRGDGCSAAAPAAPAAPEPAVSTAAAVPAPSTAAAPPLLSSDLVLALFRASCAGGLAVDALGTFGDLCERLDARLPPSELRGQLSRQQQQQQQQKRSDDAPLRPPVDWYASLIRCHARLLADVTTLARRVRLLLRGELMTRALTGGAALPPSTERRLAATRGGGSGDGGSSGGGGGASTSAEDVASLFATPAPAPRVVGRLGTFGRTASPLKSGVTALVALALPEVEEAEAAATVTAAGRSGHLQSVVVAPAAADRVPSSVRAFALTTRLLPAAAAGAGAAPGVAAVPSVPSPLLLVAPAEPYRPSGPTGGVETLLPAGVPSDVTHAPLEDGGDAVLTAGRRHSSLLASLFARSLGPLAFGPPAAAAQSASADGGSGDGTAAGWYRRSGLSGIEWHEHGRHCLDPHLFRLAPTGRLVGAFLQAAAHGAPYAYPPPEAASTALGRQQSDRDVVMSAWRVRAAALGLATDITNDVQALLTHYERSHHGGGSTASGTRDAANPAALPAPLRAALVEVARANSSPEAAVHTYLAAAAAAEQEASHGAATGRALTPELADAAIQTVAACVPAADTPLVNWLTYDATPGELRALAETKRARLAAAASARHDAAVAAGEVDEDDDGEGGSAGALARSQAAAASAAALASSSPAVGARPLTPDDLSRAERMLSAFEAFLVQLEGPPADRSNPLQARGPPMPRSWALRLGGGGDGDGADGSGTSRLQQEQDVLAGRAAPQPHQLRYSSQQQHHNQLPLGGSSIHNFSGGGGGGGAQQPQPYRASGSTQRRPQHRPRRVLMMADEVDGLSLLAQHEGMLGDPSHYHAAAATATDGGTNGSGSSRVRLERIQRQAGVLAAAARAQVAALTAAGGATAAPPPSTTSPSLPPHAPGANPHPAAWLDVAFSMFLHARHDLGLPLSHGTYAALLQAAGRRSVPRVMASVYADLRASGALPLVGAAVGSGAAAGRQQQQQLAAGAGVDEDDGALLSQLARSHEQQGLADAVARVVGSGGGEDADDAPSGPRYGAPRGRGGGGHGGFGQGGPRRGGLPSRQRAGGGGGGRQ